MSALTCAYRLSTNWFNKGINQRRRDHSKNIGYGAHDRFRCRIYQMQILHGKGKHMQGFIASHDSSEDYTIISVKKADFIGNARLHIHNRKGFHFSAN